MGKLTEYNLIEEPFIQGLINRGWNYIKSENLPRESEQEIIIQKIFFDSLININPLPLTLTDMQKIQQELLNQTNSMYGIQKVLEFFKDGVPLKLEETKTPERIFIFDYNNIENNSFIVSNQVRFYGLTSSIRVDLILYVNGIPLVVIECKNFADPTKTWIDGYRQIKDYESKVPDLFKFVQFSISAETVIKYFPNVLGDSEVRIEEWKVKDSNSTTSLDATIYMLSPSVLLDIIRNFTFVRREGGTLTKILPRYMQYEATNLIYNRVIKTLRGEDFKTKGLLWHWLGSGKTLTMVFSAFKLYREPLLENPTIFFIVDRLDLEDQLTKEYEKLYLPALPRIAEVKTARELIDILAHDNFKGKRGIFIVLVHKFGTDEIYKFHKFLEDKKESISQRKNVITFIDEAHRTQYGIMALKMKDILKNSFFFAFTGTPISSGGRDTYLSFAYLDEGEKYLHKYFIDDSIRDGFTVPITFEGYYREKISLKDEQILEFLEMKELIEDEEIPEEYRIKFEEKIKQKLSYMNVILKNEERIEKISEEIARHFKEKLDGTFKAMVIAPDREGCVLYKEKLNKFLPENWTEVVMTFQERGDKDIINNFHKRWREKYGLYDDTKIREKIIDNFKEKECPKILIVTDMLLAGFDAPIMQTIYLDKLLRGHRLLQATARVNRPYKEIKEFGLVKDFVGVLKYYHKALAFYEKDDVKNVFSEIGEKVKKFRKLVEEIKAIFVNFKSFETTRENISKAVEFLLNNPEAANGFYKKYKELRNLLLLIGYEKLHKDIQNFEWIYAVYEYFIKIKKEEVPFVDELVRKHFDKVLKKIQEKINIENLIKKLEPLTINEEYLKKLEEIYSSDELSIKVYDMYYTICRYVYIDKVRTEIFKSLIDKLQEIIRSWQEHKITSLETYEELRKIIEGIVNKENVKKNMGVVEEVFYIYQILSDKFEKFDGKLVKNINNFVSELKNNDLLFRNSLSKNTLQKEVKKRIRLFLISLGSFGIEMDVEERDVYLDKIFNLLKNYY